MADLKPVIREGSVRISEPGPDEALHPLSIPPRDLQVQVTRSAIREAAREVGDLWTPRLLHKRRNLWWDYLEVAKTDAGKATARFAIEELSVAIGRRAERDANSCSQSQPPRQGIELQIKERDLALKEAVAAREQDRKDFEAANRQPPAPAAQAKPADDNVVDADFKEVKRDA